MQVDVKKTQSEVDQEPVIQGRNIICLASNWFYDPTSKHHVMKKLAERNHILWVNYHGSRRPSLSRADAGAVVGKLRQVIEGPRRVAKNITVITPLVLPLPGNRLAMALNERMLVRQIRNALRGIGFDGAQPAPKRPGHACPGLSPVQLWSFAPDVDYLVGRFDEECVVYYCVDDFSEFRGYDREAILAAEARLCHKADLVIATSQSLLDAKKPLNENTVLVTHGVEFEHFSNNAPSTGDIPEDIESIPRPILGFWGLIQDWVDVELIAAVARARPDWSIVLIGDAATDVSQLSRAANVHLLGRRPYGSLPRYARAMDVGLIPFRVNRLTKAVNPIKLREYLSAGLPVISTPLPEVARYSSWVRIADGVEAWVLAVEQALAEKSPVTCQKRQDAMRAESWASKVEEIEAHVAQAMHPRASQSV